MQFADTDLGMWRVLEHRNFLWCQHLPGKVDQHKTISLGLIERFESRVGVRLIMQGLTVCDP